MYPEKDRNGTGQQSLILCKGAMRSDFDADTDKLLFVPAHGLYQLAACFWNEKLFRQLPMPNHKIFSIEYAIWRNTQKVQPKLFAEYPEPRINQVLTNPELEMSEQN